MTVEFECKNGCLTAFLKGEIDHHSAARMRVMIDGELERTMPRILMLDMSGVSFMDSSGIGLILGRVRNMSGWGGRVYIGRPGDTVRKIIRLSGLEHMIRQGVERNA